MEIGNKFSNLTYYNDCMKKNMNDKLFFLEKLPDDNFYTFVDFGCADGTMVNFLAEAYSACPNCNIIGYDISQTMIDLAKTNYCGPVNANVHFTTDWNDVDNILACSIDHKKVLILSSVIHEVYSYGNNESIKEFWGRVLNGFDYVVIRDMCPSKDIDRPAPKNIVDKIIYNSKATNIKYIADFQYIYGSLNNNKNLIHFLLKYRWKINWDREVHENYFPIYVNELLEKFSENYNIDYFERFRVPFLDKCILEDFNIELTDYTHIKAIFSRKK